MVKEIIDNVIHAALRGDIGVIAHGCNCWNKQKKGICVEMAKIFGTHLFPLEFKDHQGDINKLGQIDFKRVIMEKGNIWVVNAYTQYHWKENSVYGIPLDYDAFRLCIRKINSEFRRDRVGIPFIGAGLAGGDPKILRKILHEESKSIELTIYHLQTPE